MEFLRVLIGGAVDLLVAVSERVSGWVLGGEVQRVCCAVERDPSPGNVALALAALTDAAVTFYGCRSVQRLIADKRIAIRKMQLEFAQWRVAEIERYRSGPDERLVVDPRRGR